MTEKRYEKSSAESAEVGSKVSALHFVVAKYQFLCAQWTSHQLANTPNKVQSQVCTVGGQSETPLLNLNFN